MLLGYTGIKLGMGLPKLLKTEQFEKLLTFNTAGTLNQRLELSNPVKYYLCFSLPVE